MIAILRGAAFVIAAVRLFGVSLGAGRGDPSLLLEIPAFAMVFLALLPVVPRWRAVAWFAFGASLAVVTLLFASLIGSWDLPSFVFASCEIAISVALAWNHFRHRDEPNRVTWN